MDGFRVRVRTIRDAADKRSALLTLKSSRRGLVREEHEIGLDYDLAELLLSLLPPCQIIRKTRYYFCNCDELL